MTADKMTAPDLPAELKSALDAKLQGLSRSDAAARAALISKTYRDGGGSGAIRTETDALAYALARMPATYAAVTASLNALCEINPDFAPKSLLDVGAGPGTASWAAAETFSSLQDFVLLDANPALRALALELGAGSARLRAMNYQRGEAVAALAAAEAADLVVASYVIAEMDDAARRAAADLMWAKTRDTLLVVEPGTPAGYARIIALRDQLIASGAHVAAPCPHDGKCPLERAGLVSFHPAPAPLARAPADQARRAAVRGREIRLCRADPRAGRAASRPRAGAAGRGKVEVTAKLCTPDGVVLAKVPRRAKADYAQARRWRWGDAI